MVYALWGKDAFRRRQRRLQLTEGRFREVEDPELLVLELKNRGMFGELRVFVVPHTPGLEKALEQSGAAADKDTRVVVEAETLPAAFLRFAKNAGVELEEFGEMRGRSLETWIEKAFSQLGVKADAAAVSLLASLGPDTWRLHQEIQKLAAYAQGQVSKRDVEDVVPLSQGTSVFDMLDEASSGNAARALELLRRHETKGEHPLQLLALFLYQARNLLSLRDLQERHSQEKSGLPYGVVRHLSQLARRYPLPALLNLYFSLYSLDRDLKSSRAQGYQPLELLIWKISAGAL